MSAYRKIATGAGLGSRTYLYRGSDHLLLVEGTYLEEYRRFFFQDIQAAIWVPNKLWGTAVGFFATVMIAGGIGLYTLPFRVAAFFLIVPGLLMFARLGYVLAGGGYCTFYLHTAAQFTKIAGISTVRKARKVVDLIEIMTPPHSEAPPGDPVPSESSSAEVLQ